MEEEYPIKVVSFKGIYSEPRKSQFEDSEFSLGYFCGVEETDFIQAKKLNNNQWVALCKKHNWYYIKKYPL